MTMNKYKNKVKGFTLVELIVVIVLVGVMSVLGVELILAPINSFFDSARRAELVDVADNALHRMTRELRSALPNSVRTSVSATRVAIEFLHTSTGGRYRARSGSLGTEILQNCQNDMFDVLGGVTGVISAGPAGQANCMNGNSDCLVVYNTGYGAGDFNAYNGDNIAAITAVDTIADTLTCDNGAGWFFPFPIPASNHQRFYVVDMPISFVCDTASNELRRYADYTITAAQPITDANFGLAGNVLANNIASCQFDYNAGAGTRHGLVTLRLWISEAQSGENISLLHQIHVINVP